MTPCKSESKNKTLHIIYNTRDKKKICLKHIKPQSKSRCTE